MNPVASASHTEARTPSRWMPGIVESSAPGSSSSESGAIVLTSSAHGRQSQDCSRTPAQPPNDLRSRSDPPRPTSNIPFPSPNARSTRRQPTEARETPNQKRPLAPSVLGDLHGRPVGANLGPGAAQLGGVEAERDHGVSALCLGLLNEPLGGVLAALSQHLGHALELAADQRLERGAHLRADVPRAHRQAEHLAQHLVDGVARQLVHGADDHVASVWWFDRIMW
jgi:hypothetical protein